ncbi:MAG: hypothetical protein KKB51_04570 [Candidatus Riflebacteria bacterium]|nr:hypothetical protein [Candidatus Riflebacteria bacterium]
MWTIVQIVVCLVFLVLAAFWIGKKLGQRRFYQMNEEMRALELSFKNLMEDMEMVSAHNMKVLEVRTEEIKEVLTVADRKSIYVSDLLKEMDESSASLRMRNLGGSAVVTSIEQGTERKFYKEIQSSLEDILNRMGELDTRTSELEDNPIVPDKECVAELIRIEVSRQLKAISQELQISRKDSTRAEMQFGAVAAEKTAERVVPMRPVRESFVDSATVAELLPTTKSGNVKELRIAQINEGARLPATIKMTDLEKPRELPCPPAGFPVREVLKMYEDGVTLPQIARSLHMSKSEIELILKFYGEGIKMRKIV